MATSTASMARLSRYLRRVRRRLTLWTLAVMAPVLIGLSIWGYGNAQRPLHELSDVQLTDRATLIAYDLNVVHHKIDLSGYRKDQRVHSRDNLVYVADAKGQVIDGPPIHGIPWILPSRGLFQRALQIQDTTPSVALQLNGKSYHFVTVPVFDGERVIGAVQAGLPTSILDDKITRLLWVQILGTVLALAVTAGGGVFLAYRASRPIETAAAQQEQFTNDAAHDLRTPITVIRGQADVALSDLSLDAGALRQVLVRVREESERLGGLVDDLLTLARDEALGPGLQRQTFPLEELALVVAGRAAPIAVARGLRLTTEGAGTAEVKGDFHRLEQALLNCVDNALKYSVPGGEVTIRPGQDQRYGWIEVSDRGAGISAEAVDRVGTRFYQAGTESERAEPRGSGLGLAIARRVAELHGGKLTVASVEGQGTQVRLYLPRLPREEARDR